MIWNQNLTIADIITITILKHEFFQEPASSDVTGGHGIFGFVGIDNVLL